MFNAKGTLCVLFYLKKPHTQESKLSIIAVAVDAVPARQQPCGHCPQPLAPTAPHHKHEEAEERNPAAVADVPKDGFVLGRAATGRTKDVAHVLLMVEDPDGQLWHRC